MTLTVRVLGCAPILRYFRVFLGIAWLPIASPASKGAFAPADISGGIVVTSTSNIATWQKIFLFRQDGSFQTILFHPGQNGLAGSNAPTNSTGAGSCQAPPDSNGAKYRKNSLCSNWRARLLGRFYNYCSIHGEGPGTLTAERSASPGNSLPFLQPSVGTRDVSSLNFVALAGSITTGFVTIGTSSRSVLIRALEPGLQEFRVSRFGVKPHGDRIFESRT